MTAEFPEARDFFSDEQALKDMDLVMGVISGVRNIRGEMNIAPSQKVNVLIEIPDQNEAEVVRKNISHIQNLARIDTVAIEAEAAKPDASATAVFGRNQVHVLLKGLMDFNEEKKRLTKEIKKIGKDMEAANKKLANREFLAKAPPEIVEKVSLKVEALNLKLEKLNRNLSFFESIQEK
jgi:valyl-tRNA synthetase